MLIAQLVSVPGAQPETSRKAVPTLRAGDWVEVLSADDILATLDSNQCLDGMPFMPEMLQYCGRTFRVHKSAHKTCDTINKYTIRRMDDAVHLEDLRCDGQAHGGCQAGCLLFFKNAWLRPVPPPANAADSPRTLKSAELATADLTRLHEATRVPAAESGGQELFRCQATELLKATSEVRRRDKWSPMFFLRDVTSRNVSFLHFLWYGTIAVFNTLMLRVWGWRYPRLRGLAGDKTPHLSLNLQAGDWVRVRSKEEIMQTLNADQRNRGLFFDVEMTPFCGGDYKVKTRVEKIVDEKTGRMLKMPNASLILDGVTCGGCMSSNRMFCPRGIYPYWREIWLERSGKPKAR
jgi:hypothetical protein